MIRVKRILSEEELCGLEIKGHANSDEHGKDLVCAAVSSIITGGFNALVKDEIEEITLEEGYAKVVVKKFKIFRFRTNYLIDENKRIYNEEEIIERILEKR